MKTLQIISRGFGQTYVEVASQVVFRLKLYNGHFYVNGCATGTIRHFLAKHPKIASE